MDYKEKIRLAKEALDSGSYDKETIEYIFPELKESEDERIRKELIAMVRLSCTNSDDVDKKIAWLEKQGKQKPADKVEPKFKVGDKIIDKSFPKNVFTVTEIINEGIAYVDKTGERFTKYYDEDDWDEYELVEQKPAWSEEDELHIRELESLVKQVWATAEHKNDKDTIHKMSDLSFFLKTLKPQNQWKPSDGQMDALRYVTNFDYGGHKATLVSLYEQLKKLKR